MSQLTNTGHLTTAKASATRARQLTGANITLVEALKMGRSGGLQKKLSDAVASQSTPQQLKYSYAQE
jgi:hypothetical protein